MRAANQHIERRARRERRRQLRMRCEVQAASIGQTPRRKGSTLLVVMALMGMLALLGLMFFSFASQENESAKNYLEAAKLIHDPDLGPDVYFDWFLRQAIRGPEREERQSALAGGYMAILSNQFGRDAHPHTGAGLTIVNDRTTDLAAPTSTLGTLRLTVGADLDGDGMADSVTQGGPLDLNANGIHDAIEMNRSTAANVINPNGGLPARGVPHIDFEHRTDRLPEPDVDYTYPDVNNAFLAHIAKIWVTEGDADGSGTFDADEDFNGNGVVDATPYEMTIIKPSYWRPELLTRFEDSAATAYDEAGPDGVWDPLTEDANPNGLYDTNDFNGNGDTASAEDALARLDPTWYWAPWSRSLILRPHPLHFFIPQMQRQIPGMASPPPPAPPTELRFLRDGDPVDDPIIATLPGGSKGFPFAGPRDLTSGDTIPLREGLWRGWQQEYSEDLNGNGSLDPGEDRNGNGVIDQVSYEFDADPDNDGIREAILMDLGFPVQERPSDGALYVPMFAVTIYDADGLINLNTSGNLSGDATPPDGSAPFSNIFGNGRGLIPFSAWPPPPGQAPLLSISESLHGLTPFEVNPLWALDAIPIDPSNPTPAQTADVIGIGDFLEYYGRNPIGNGDAINRWELANMELFWLNKGRIEFPSGPGFPEIHAGRLGEENRVQQVLEVAGGGPSAGGVPPISLNLYNTSATAQTINLFPFPGYFDRDDNRNANYGGQGNQASGRTLAFGHPLSVSGRGRFTAAANPKQLNQHMALGSPMRWMSYVDYDVAGAPQWATGAVVGGNLVTGTRAGGLFANYGADGVPDLLSNPNSDDALVDDMTELTIEPRSAKRPADGLLSVSEIAAIHMSKTDIDQVGAHSHLHNLMPANINPNDSSVDANDRRRQFTTMSFDRKQFSLPIHSDPGADGQPGQAGVDDNKNGLVDEAQELGWPGTDDHRSWEFNVDSDGDGKFEFPPQFGVAAYSGQNLGRLPMVPQDPFRAELRRLLSVERGNQSELKLQFRINLNQLLDVVRTGQNGGHSTFSALEFRPLTPHPNASQTLAGGNSIPRVTPGEQLPPISSMNPEVQEFWARYDRQRMARDIYVTLYTLCGGDASTVGALTLTPLNSGYYSAQEMQEMAQFAVNIVDQLDPDNVFTVFEYDTDLSDGWNLDDQAITDEGTTDRGIAVGVEAQELTLSETLWVFQEELANDNDHTPFDETNPPTGTGGTGTPGFHFAQIELRNAGPRTINLAHPTVSTSATTGVWRLRWQDTSDIGDIDQVSTGPTLPSGNGIVFKGSGAGSINAGGLFTIATSNNTAPDSSDLYADLDNNTSDFELIAPRFGSASTTVTSTNPTNVTPNTNLDLANTTGSNQQRFELINGVNGDFLSEDYEPTSLGTRSGADWSSSTVLVLERRADPSQPQLSIAQNPWVVVDWTKLMPREFVPTPAATSGSPDSSDMTNALQTLESHQRIQPLEGATAERSPAGPDSNRRNTLMGNNSGSPAVYDLVQLHYDRDFASLGELLNLSIASPMYTTRSVTTNDSFTAADIILDPLATVGGGGGGPPGGGPPGGGPPGMGGGIGNGLGNGGVPPGLAKQINRYGNHWHRLLSLAEVPTRMHEQLGSEFETTRVPGKINLNTLRHPEVLAALFDNPFLHGEVSPVTGIMPGIDGNNWWGDFLLSRDGEHPDFPGTGFTLPGYFDSEPFRDLGHTDDLTAGHDPVQDTILRDRPTGVPGPPSGGLFDVDVPAGTPGHDLLRRQLLMKVMNNTTTRSNVFFAFVQVQFHEAYEDPATGAIRVGGRIDLNGDSIRDDGHRGFFVIDRSAAEEAYDTKTGTFDWRQLVKHRLTIN